MNEALDFSRAVPNPHFKHLSEELTLRLDLKSIAYFQQLGQPYGLTAEEMIVRYLRHLAGTGYQADLGLLTPEQRRQLEASLDREHDSPTSA